MNKKIEDLMVGLRTVGDSDFSKIQYIWMVTAGNGVNLTGEDYRELISRIKPGTDESNLAVPFIKQIQEYWTNRNLPTGNFHHLSHGIVLVLLDCLTADSKTPGGLNDVILSMFFPQAVFFCGLAAKTGNSGAACSLMRLFGEVASMDLLARLAKEELSKLEMTMELKNALASGALKRYGEWDVWLSLLPKIHVSKALRDPEVIKAEIDATCINGASDKMIQKRAELLFELGEVIGAAEAKAWFEDKYPHLVSS